jgi:hypothetical protein
MTDDRMSGLALIAGSVGTIITMSLHPSGPIAPEEIERVARMLIAVHALALACLPVMFLGAWGLSRRVGTADRLGVAALVLYGFAMVAVMNAAVADGLVAPNLLRQIVATASAAGEGWRIALKYNFQWNQAFAQVYVAASSAAIVLWSASILRSGALARGVGIYGCILGPVTLVAVFSGLLNLGAHGFGLVVFGQALWFIIVGVLLCRVRNV